MVTINLSILQLLDLTTFVGTVASVIFFTQWIDNTWHLVDWPARIRSWCVGILLGLIGMKFQLGIYADPVFGIVWMPLWLVDSILGFLAAFVANLGYKYTDWVKAFLQLIQIKVPIGTPPESGAPAHLNPQLPTSAQK